MRRIEIYLFFRQLYIIIDNTNFRVITHFMVHGFYDVYISFQIYCYMVVLLMSTRV